MKHFELMDISGDAGVRAYGKSLEDVFIRAAEGMYSLITEPGSIVPRKSLDVSASGSSAEGLLVAWLNELIFHFDTYGFLGRDFQIHELRDDLIKATLSGEDFDPERHGGGLLIKAATYHRLKIERKEGHWEAEVIFDI